MTGSRTQSGAEIGKRRRQRTLRLGHDRREGSRVCRWEPWNATRLLVQTSCNACSYRRTWIHEPTWRRRGPVLTTNGYLACNRCRWEFACAGPELRSAACTVKGRDGHGPHVIHAVLVDAVLRQECAQVSGRKSGIPRQHGQPARRQAATSPDASAFRSIELYDGKM